MISVDPKRAVLPDVPKWVEPKDSLSAGDADVFQFEEGDVENVAVLDRTEDTLFVVGRLTSHEFDKMANLLGRCTSLIVEIGQNDDILTRLHGWRSKNILVFTSPSSLSLSSETISNVKFLNKEEIIRAGLANGLKVELLEALKSSEIAASYSEGKPVAFCYAASQSQKYWDVSVDTLPEYRRKGHAKRCALFMMSYMQSKGKEVVWQSFDDNPSSWNLAKSIGLIQTDRLTYCERQD